MENLKDAYGTDGVEAFRSHYRSDDAVINASTDADVTQCSARLAPQRTAAHAMWGDGGVSGVEAQLCQVVLTRINS